MSIYQNFTLGHGDDQVEVSISDMPEKGNQHLMVLTVSQHDGKYTSVYHLPLEDMLKLAGNLEDYAKGLRTRLAGIFQD